MIKIFKSADGDEILVRTVNQWLEDNPTLFIQSFNYQTYYQSSFGSEDKLVHSLVVNYITQQPIKG